LDPVALGPVALGPVALGPVALEVVPVFAGTDDRHADSSFNQPKHTQSGGRAATQRSRLRRHEVARFPTWF
jgi:hypothetical protein